MNLNTIRAMQASADDAWALHALELLTPAEADRSQAATLALALGRPRLAALWAQGHDPLLQAAALLRLGEADTVLKVLKGQPDSARVSLLRARALTRGGYRKCTAVWADVLDALPE